VSFRKRLRFEIAKSDPNKRLVFGWAYSAVLDGKPVIDHDNDVVEPAELEKAAHEYVRFHRTGSEMHESMGVSECVESVFVDAQKAEAMGIAKTDDVRWWIGFKVKDDRTWDAVQAGVLKEFSIGGDADRQPHPTIEGAYTLKNLRVKEIALVDKGAGLAVPVAFKKKGSKMNEILKRLIETIVKNGGTIEKADLKPALESAGLTEEQIAIVMGLMEAIVAPPGEAGAPAPEPIEEAMAEEDKAEMGAEEEKAEDEMEDKAEGEKEGDEMAKRLSDLAKRVADAERREAVALAKARVSKEFAHVPGMSETELAELIVSVNEGGLGKSGESLLKSLASVSETIAKSDAFATFGSRAPAPTRPDIDPADRFGVIAEDVTKNVSAGMSRSEAINKATQMAIAEGRL
jgi:hypothetical protein